MRWWGGAKPYDAHVTRDAVVRAIKRALDDAGMEIPFPYRTLTFKEALPITRQKTDNNSEINPEEARVTERVNHPSPSVEPDDTGL